MQTGYRLRRTIITSLAYVGAVLLFLITLAISPLLILLYILWLLKAKCTSCIYSFRKIHILDGGDALSGYEFNTPNSIINCICMYQGKVPVKALRDLFMENVLLRKDSNSELLFPKFSRYVALRSGYLMWLDEKTFTIEKHVTAFRGAPPKNEDELKELVAKICSLPLPPKRSGWKVIAIPLGGEFDQPLLGNPHLRVPQTCVLIRVHHSIADGLSLVRLMVEHLADKEGDCKDILRRMAAKMSAKANNCCERLVVHLARYTYAFVFAPFVYLEQLVGCRDENIVHGPKLSGTKIVEWSPAISLQLIKDIKNVTSTTVNDVIVSCLSGGLRRFILSRNEKVPTSISVIIPINLQGPDDPLNMRNTLSFVIAELPTAESDALERLKSVKRVMDGLKRSPTVLANKWFFKYCVNVIPNCIIEGLLNRSPPSAIFSNVPGPSKRVSTAKFKLVDIIPFLPHRGDIGISTCIFSYAGDVRVSLAVDAALIDKPGIRQIVSGFLSELQDLTILVKV